MHDAERLKIERGDALPPAGYDPNAQSDAGFGFDEFGGSGKRQMPTSISEHRHQRRQQLRAREIIRFDFSTRTHNLNRRRTRAKRRRDQPSAFSFSFDDDINLGAPDPAATPAAPAPAPATTGDAAGATPPNLNFDSRRRKIRLRRRTLRRPRLCTTSGRLFFRRSFNSRTSAARATQPTTFCGFNSGDAFGVRFFRFRFARRC
jgi:hypothetical protein